MLRLSSAVVLLIAGFLVACTKSQSNGTPTDPGGNPSSTAQVVLTILGQAGTERDMIVRYVIGDGATTRAAAAAMTPTPFGCFSDINSVCPITVPVGKTITFFAIEGEGYVAGDASNGRPVPAPDPLRHEFISFGGDCATSAVLGECSLPVTTSKTYNVRADFAQMRSVVFRLHGAGALRYRFTVRDRLSFPNRPYTNTNPDCCAGGVPYVPGAPLVYGYLPTGSTVTATRQTVGSGLSQFIQWSGPCNPGGGVEAACTLVAGGAPTPTVTALFEYYDCGSMGVSDGGTGTTPPAGCTKVRPSAGSSAWQRP